MLGLAPLLEQYRRLGLSKQTEYFHVNHHIDSLSFPAKTNDSFTFGPKIALFYSTAF